MGENCDRDHSVMKELVMEVRQDIKELRQEYARMDKRLEVFANKTTVIATAVATVGGYVLNFLTRGD